ncbi:23S rRNA pseudouridine(1911/1915/1917) synthase RluD [Candidatus Pseudothioglobus singularis]|jgi:23S rRNA pseudouridine1911/1915/1917 synthase|uniref:Pseudouridine synthase n=1 Tax=Candidatus Pseudothioglobus singularis PS1 TaxID=1125411 RepID=A0A0M5KRZ0_9GAMM|nr:23S rRNA pseudouridine(1911/1915/1917) synthase RluD [Candidatus Pseudothioglobus singularis]ALE02190.1 23S rRNA pseudouridine synthase D [Candidatus Pseudothioglobus singularis PS1]
MEILQIIIPKRMKDQRIDAALTEMIPDYSRSKIITWIKSGDALINNKTFKPKDKVNGNEMVCLKVKQKNNIQWLPEKINLNIVFEDNDIIVINKPFGLVTHPGSGNWSGTLANALLHYDSHLSSLDRAGIVHRLDKNTSGLMVVSKNLKSQKFLVEQLQNHSIQREYSAIVYGHMISGGSIDEPIGRDPKDRVKQAILTNGKQAKTHYRVIDRFKSHTHVKAILETGRTHQIRVHLSHVGYPLIGDPMYGGRVRFPKKASQELKDELINFQRQALHSKKLTLKHPVTGETMTWKADLPDDMQELLNILKKYDS